MKGHSQAAVRQKDIVKQPTMARKRNEAKRPLELIGSKLTVVSSVTVGELRGGTST